MQHKQAVKQEQLLSFTRISPKKGSFKSFLVYNQSVGYEDEAADEYKTYCQLSALKTAP